MILVQIREGPIILSKVKVTPSFINRKKLKAAKGIPSNAIIITTRSVARDHKQFFNDIGCNIKIQCATLILLDTVRYFHIGISSIARFGHIQNAAIYFENSLYEVNLKCTVSMILKSNITE